ncbi:MFS transporter [Psychrobacter sp. YP14]|uniref:Nitrate/nitrite transporter n=2 Tax=Psychrobacter TaxID=497 RepID=A0A844M2N7_9GAMM|nr:MULTISPECIES: NarK family nitrate/nitrite MFS transporter [Psychrobacter]AWT49306.1 MFS transporter [Psychrobacter sp. YP14]MUG33206.1 NarK family nitrate/nitrite MFS transporter [Psychrobacter sanguinis]
MSSATPVPPSKEKLNVLSFAGKNKILHLGWMAFFLTFFVWFNHAPFLSAIGETLDLTKQQVKTLLILNVALTIPARVIIGMLTDKFGPRIVYTCILALGAIPCFTFAFAQDYTTLALSRFILGFVGAGFVVGIRLISDWFPANELGAAEGIYGGWGNFGSAAAAMLLPTIAIGFAAWFGGDEGWRYACATSGVVMALYSILFYKFVRDTPKGSTYFKPKKSGAMAVTSKGDFWLMMIFKLPMYLALALLAWKLSPAGVSLLSQSAVNFIYIGLALLYVYEFVSSYRFNKEVFTTEVPESQRYDFKQVGVLNILYFATFGSELAVVSMLPLFYLETFEVSVVAAGLLASSYAFMNLMSRPGGGWLSDRFGRKSTLLILTAGLAVGYFLMGIVDSTWPIALALLITMFCSFFVQAGEGAVFAVIPLIKRSMTGQFAGMTGAYGNVGSVVYLTVLSLVSYQTFFMVIAVTAVIGFLALFLLKEPSGVIVEEMPDGTFAEISVT